MSYSTVQLYCHVFLLTGGGTGTGAFVWLLCGTNMTRCASARVDKSGAARHWPATLQLPAPQALNAEAQRPARPMPRAAPTRAGNANGHASITLSEERHLLLHALYAARAWRRCTFTDRRNQQSTHGQTVDGDRPLSLVLYRLDGQR
jgi:hypothetical protein